MAFPSVTSSSSGVTTPSINTTTHTLTWPSTINAGELLLAITGLDGGATLSTLETGVSNKKDILAPSSRARATFWTKTATGSESGTWDIASSATEKMAWIILSIADWGTDEDVDVRFSTGGTGTSSNPDSDSLSVSGSAEYMWCTSFGMDRARTVTSWVSSYADNNIESNGGGSTGCSAVFSSRELETGTAQNPTTYSMSAVDEWAAVTLAIGQVAIVGGPLINAGLVNAGLNRGLIG